jgi:hypothetical protein
MTLMAGCCIVIGLSGFAVPRLIGPAVASLTGMPVESIAEVFLASGNLLNTLSISIAVVVALLGIATIVRLLILRTRSVRTAVTWDCGYAAPTARMQYRGYSFIQTATSLFAGLISLREKRTLPSGVFPRKSLVVVKVPDGILSSTFEPLFRGVAWTLGRLRWLQHGNVHLYILYIMITLLALMFWNLR